MDYTQGFRICQPFFQKIQNFLRGAAAPLFKIFWKNLKKVLTNWHNLCIMHLAPGRLAQLARASAWRAEGHRFESYIVHQTNPHPFGWGFLFGGQYKYRTRTHSSATCRCQVAAASANTGGYSYFLPSLRGKKMQVESYGFSDAAVMAVDKNPLWLQ